MQEDRYLSKLETLIKEEEFIRDHRIEDEITERALLHALEISVEISMDIIEADFLRQMNGVRNFIVHRYNKLDMDIINEALSRISELKGMVIKIAEY